MSQSMDLLSKNTDQQESPITELSPIVPFIIKQQYVSLFEFLPETVFSIRGSL